MAKCSFGNHGECGACGQFVEPAASHVHHYSTKRGGITTAICRECSSIVFVASACLLNAVEDYRKASGDNSTVYELVRDQRIVVAVEQILMPDGA